MFKKNLHILLLLLSTCHPIKSFINEQQRKSGYIGGDFIIGALLPIHEKPNYAFNTGHLACGQIHEPRGIQRAEAAFFAIDSINNDPQLLPGIKLGINIKDDCLSESLAIFQTIKLLQDPTKEYDNETSEFACTPNKDKIIPLIGIVGPTSSATTIQVQNLLKLFQIPQIGYSATSSELEKSEIYPYFTRVVLHDFMQSHLIIQILEKFSWTYVFTFYSSGTEGENLSKKLDEIVSIKKDICIVDSIKLSVTDNERYYDNIIENLQKYEKVRVIICFCDGSTIRRLFRSFKKHNLTNKYQLIVSDGWAPYRSIEQDYEEQARGSLIIGIKSSINEKFDNYYLQKNLTNNKRNPWFEEFWEYKFDCKINPKENSTSLPKCTGQENLRFGYEQDSKISYIIKSIYAMAHGLHKMQADICENVTKCNKLYPFNSTRYMEYLMKVNFTLFDDYMNFTTDRGQWDINYNIYNFQKTRAYNNVYDYVEIGRQNKHFAEVTINKTKIQFTDGSRTPPKSTCSDPCPPGHSRQSRSDQEKSCCWNCEPCKSNQILINETCQTCKAEYQPDSNHLDCIQSPLIYAQWTDIESVISLTLSLIGITLTVIAFFIFVKHRETPVVKSSTRELCYLMLIGMIMAHTTVFWVVAKPTIVSCTLMRIVPAISFTMIYASLLLKTNRIARILAISKKKFPSLNPKFISLRAQIVITLILIAAEMIICCLMLYIEPPYPNKTESLQKEDFTIFLKCPLSFTAVIIPFSFVAILIIMSTLYAVKSRNLPDNFNEAKFIGFAMYATCITWIAFCLVYFGSNFQTLTACICASANSLIILIFLFFPKIYIIVWVPEKNTRSNFTTSKGIRCIIGRKDNTLKSAKNRYSHETNFKHISQLNKLKNRASKSDLQRELNLPHHRASNFSCSKWHVKMIKKNIYEKPKNKSYSL